MGRLLGNGALDQIALGVGRDLAGTPDLAGGFDGLAVWPCCCWREGGGVSKWYDWGLGWIAWTEVGCDSTRGEEALVGWISFAFDQVEIADLSRLHSFRFYLRGQASFVNTFVSSLDMLFVMILLSFRRSCSLFLASSVSATTLISLLGSGSFWKASCLNS